MPAPASPQDGGKRFRSLKEYREQKRQRKAALSSQDKHSEPVSSSDSEHGEGFSHSKAEFIKILDNTVDRICSEWFLSDTSTANNVSKLITRTLLDKECRMSEEFRFRVAEQRHKDAAAKRIGTYTEEYLRRKFPR